MSNALRTQLLRILSNGEFHSGEQLGHQLGMSRAAISKHIKVIESWGLDIFKVTGKGYRLATPLALLDEAQLQQAFSQQDVSVFTSIDSTNNWLLSRIGQIREGHLCFAEHQSAGKGRRGRTWVSPVGSNLMFSMYWQMPDGMAAAMGVSLVAGVAVVETLRDMGLTDVRLKWPNDIYAQDKKLAGILVEMTGQAGGMAHLVIGIGLNIQIPEQARQQINQPLIDLFELKQQPIERTNLAIRLGKALRQALTMHRNQGLNKFISRWNDFDNYRDRPVVLWLANRQVQGIGRGINAQGAFCLETEQGLEAFVGGEISLRGQHATVD